jgi:tRNA(fMet)-specific endonuclease VapC
VDTHHADIRNKLERTGRLIGPNDMLIAAHARATDCIAVTANLREFRRVPGLKVQDWLDSMAGRRVRKLGAPT